MSADQGKNPLTLFFEWIGDQMYGVWLLFKPTSGADQSPGEEARPPNSTEGKSEDTDGTLPVSPSGES